MLVGTKLDEFQNIQIGFQTILSEFDYILDRGDQSHHQAVESLNNLSMIDIDTSFEKAIQEKFYEQIEDFEKKYQFLNHVKCSALTGEGVKNIFDLIIMSKLHCHDKDHNHNLCANEPMTEPEQTKKGWFGF